MSAYAMISCGNCGHRVPIESARSRGYATCTCGAIIQPPRAPVSTVAVRALLALGGLAGLATAVAAIAHHLH